MLQSPERLDLKEYEASKWLNLNIITDRKKGFCAHILTLDAINSIK